MSVGPAAHHLAGTTTLGRHGRGHANASLALRRLQDTPRTAPSWQGVSVAQWLMPRGNVPLIFRPADRTAGDAPPVRPGGGSLRVVTNNLRPGYLRKNGIPYGQNVVLTEHWDLYKRPNGEEWLTITQQIEDPQNLRNVKLIAPVFKKEANGAKWDRRHARRGGDCFQKG